VKKEDLNMMISQFDPEVDENKAAVRFLVFHFNGGHGNKKDDCALI
jgi:glucan phosphoethanolaminetransferase (alkaline phosphatase superfamily)